jgi:hypothetical protein
MPRETSWSVESRFSVVQVYCPSTPAADSLLDVDAGTRHEHDRGDHDGSGGAASSLTFGSINPSAMPPGRARRATRAKRG